MRAVPFISLAIALFFLAAAWIRRKEFSNKPYFHWFIYFNMTAVGLHQFEEYGWPGNFREAFIGVFNNAGIIPAVPSVLSLELLNAFGLMLVFGLIGWYGTRVKWIGLLLLFINFSNGFFHLVYSVTQMTYLPGVITGTLLYLPLGLLAAGYALVHRDVSRYWILIAFYTGTFAGFLPFIHVWLMHSLKNF